jgi:ribosome biogenesis GTPase
LRRKGRAADDALSAALLRARVVAVYRRQVLVALASGEERACMIRGRRLEPACGDEALVAIPESGPGVVHELAERASCLQRTDDWRTKVIAANAGQVCVVVATEPAFSEELLHRVLLAAEAAGLRGVVALNKADLPYPAGIGQRLTLLRSIGCRVVELAARRDVGPLRELLAGERTVLVGQSGMGKSTILNALVPEARAREGEISAALGTGRHTTTFSRLHPLPEGGWVVDTPGLQAFGLRHLDRGALEHAFVEFRPFLGDCRFNDCRHESEPGCAIVEAVARGAIAPQRLEWFRRFARGG